MGFRLSHGVNLYKALNANVMLVDYRGYGDGVGKPTEVGLIKDGEAVLDTLKKHEKIDRYDWSACRLLVKKTEQVCRMCASCLLACHAQASVVLGV